MNLINILDSIGDCILVINRDHKILSANKAFLDLVGLNSEDVVGKDCHAFSHSMPTPCHRGDIKAHTCPHQRVFAGGETISVTHTHIMPDGVERVFEITASPVRDEDGNTIEMIEVMRDVTERLELERRLKESEEEFRALVEKSLVGVYLIQDGIFRYVNPRLAEFFGYTKDELIEKKGPKDLVHPDDWYIVEENIRKRIEGEVESVNYTFRGLKKDGGVFDVEVYGSKTVYKGRPAVIGTLLDITEKKRYADELNRRLKELEQFYDIAIKRELTMIKMKAEIERLKGELRGK
ncbi:MAG: hypothetical protein Fur0020_10380 [Thermodesulfovibrionia bacterium]